MEKELISSAWTQRNTTLKCFLCLVDRERIGVGPSPALLACPQPGSLLPVVPCIWSSVLWETERVLLRERAQAQIPALPLTGVNHVFPLEFQLSLPRAVLMDGSYVYEAVLRMLHPQGHTG